MEEHSGQALFITFGLGAQDDLTIRQEWSKCAQVYEDFITYLLGHFLVGGILTGFEMYTKNKARKSSKVLRPHVHMVLFTYNDFLSLSKDRLEIHLATFMDDFKVDALKTPQDAAKAAAYTLKSSRQTVLKQVCAAMFNTTPDI